MFTSFRALTVPFVLAMLTGCAMGQAEDGALGTASSAALSYNALSYNALSYNALSYNALSYNALSYNALSYNALSYNALQDPGSAGNLSRQLLQYTTGCALNPSQSLSFSWMDTQGVVHDESYAGQLGLAPQWADGPLTSSSSQQLVSACLAARTNYFGVTVSISARGNADALQDNTTSAELAAYSYVEGAFWGNLFSSSPALYSCYDPANVAHSRASQRECATGYVDGNGQVQPCGMITLTGSCTDQCKKIDSADGYFWGCGDSGNGKGNSTAITIGLQ